MVRSWIIFFVLLMSVFFLIMSAIYYINNAEWTPGNKRIAAEEKELLYLNTECEIIGDAKDKGRYGVVYRTIYECPDGKVHIR